MIKNKLYQKAYFFVVLITLVSIILGFAISALVARSLSLAPPPGPLTAFIKMIDETPISERSALIAKIEHWNENGPERLFLIDENGRVLYPANTVLEIEWSKVKKPTPQNKSVELHSNTHFGPPENHLFWLSGSPTQYLRSSLQIDHSQVSTFFLILNGSLFLSIVLGVGVSFLVIFRTLRKKVFLADSVIAELRKGNLKARFPIAKMDEVGQAMSRFNEMANEIERLVEQMKRVEKSRMMLLQELAHDLRTPIASLKVLLDILKSPKNPLEPKLEEELVGLSLKEVDYFERLVEDLLVLAQVSEPAYKTGQVAIRLDELLEEEAESAKARFMSSKTSISLRKEFLVQIEIFGDLHLLRRMIRNIFDNAFSFAQSEVFVSLNLNETGESQVLIKDDGLGFSEEALMSFGERRISRILGSGQGSGGERLSVGLGSVIISTIARIHRGSVQASNQIRDGRLVGAQVLLGLPIAKV